MAQQPISSHNVNAKERAKVQETLKNVPTSQFGDRSRVVILAKDRHELRQPDQQQLAGPQPVSPKASPAPVQQPQAASSGGVDARPAQADVGQRKADMGAPAAPQAAYEPDSSLPFSSQRFLRFADAVAGIESGGRYDIVGGYNNHYLGKYQMGKAALKDVGVGYTDAERQAYLSDPSAQDDAFEAFTLQNHNFLTARSEKYRAMSEVDQLAVLGYAHNQGRGGALRFLESGVSEQDGFGTEASKYFDAVKLALTS